MCDRSHILADSDRICTDGAHMDSIADTPYSRDHEYGGGSITALKYSKENKNYDCIIRFERSE